MTQKSVTKNHNSKLQPCFVPIITKLTEIRDQLDVNQFDLECKIGIARGYLSKWERGQRTPTFFNFICWTSALDLEIEFKPVSPKYANDNGELISNKNLSNTPTSALNNH